MRYRFPVYAKGQHGPVKLTGDCEACQVDERVPVKSLGDVEAPDGWEFSQIMDLLERQPVETLAALAEAATESPDDVDAIIPWTSDRVPLAPGCNPIEMARRFYSLFPNELVDVDGYSFCGVAILRSGRKAYNKTRRAQRAWTFATSDVVACSGYKPYEKMDTLARRVASYLKPTQRQVVFVFREFPVCGVTLAATHICNGLNRLGWNATVACTSMDPAQAKLFPFEFGLMVFKGLDELVRVLSKRTDKTSVVVAPVHAMVETAARVSENSGAELVYYVQDDERRFKQTSGVPYYKAEDIEGGWAKVAGQGRLVANSGWVSAMLDDAGHRPDFVPIGVDTETFKPGDRSKPPFKIMAHCRPSTPRRGWGFIAAVLNQVTIRGLDFEAVTYDEHPLGLEVRKHRDLGRLSPQQVADEMSTAHIFIEGSDVQGFGMQALEAMSSGCALVCTANRGIDTFGAHGSNCIIVRHGDVGGAADAIMRLATDLDLRKGLGQRAREQALKFEWREVCKAWDRVLRNERSAANEADT